MSSSEQPGDFESVKARLSEIAEQVEDENISLDDALALYEEAVTLGLRASDLLETGIVAPDDEELAEEAKEADELESSVSKEGSSQTDSENHEH